MSLLVVVVIVVVAMLPVVVVEALEVAVVAAVVVVVDIFDFLGKLKRAARRTPPAAVCKLEKMRWAGVDEELGADRNLEDTGVGGGGAIDSSKWTEGPSDLTGELRGVMPRVSDRSRLVWLRAECSVTTLPDEVAALVVGGRGGWWPTGEVGSPIGLSGKTGYSLAMRSSTRLVRACKRCRASLVASSRTSPLVAYTREEDIALTRSERRWLAAMRRPWSEGSLSALL